MIDRSDKETLLASPAFRRFMFDIVQRAGVFEAGPPSADHRFLDGRRSLALELLHDLETVQAVRSDTGIPVVTSIQLFQEAVQAAGKNNPTGRQATYDELRDSD